MVQMSLLNVLGQNRGVHFVFNNKPGRCLSLNMPSNRLKIIFYMYTYVHVHTKRKP